MQSGPIIEAFWSTISSISSTFLINVWKASYPFIRVVRMVLLNLQSVPYWTPNRSQPQLWGWFFKWHIGLLLRFFNDFWLLFLRAELSVFTPTPGIWSRFVWCWVHCFAHELWETDLLTLKFGLLLGTSFSRTIFNNSIFALLQRPLSSRMACQPYSRKVVRLSPCSFSNAYFCPLKPRQPIPCFS